MKKVFPWKKTKYAVLQAAFKILLGLIIASSAIACIYIGRKPYGQELTEGDICLQTIYAPMDFTYRIGIDEEKTKKAREAAAATVEEIYEIDRESIQKQLGRLEQFFDYLLQLQGKTEIAIEEKVNLAASNLQAESTKIDLRSLLEDPDLNAVKAKTVELLKKALVQGIIDSDVEKRWLDSKKQLIFLRDQNTGEEIGVHIDRFSNLNKAKKDLTLKMQDLFSENRRLRIAVIGILEEVLKPNVAFNQQLTAQRRQLAYDNAPEQYREQEIKKEERIIGKGERVAKEHLLRINEMSRLQVKASSPMFLFGATILILIFLSMVAVYLKQLQPKIFISTSKLTLIGALFVLILGLAKIITHTSFAVVFPISSLPSYLIPTAIASIMVAMLIGPQVAIIITVALSILVGVIAGDKLNVATVSFVGGIVGIFAIQGARRRSQILIAGILVGIANFITICAIGLLYGLKHGQFFYEGFFGFFNGILSAIIITGILPIFEYLFNIVTNISLLELSDLNHPLLKEMVLKAPGTYHHSLIVGNLAEAACDAIGAKALLARVGSYFHDIGKIEKAGYFSENQIGTAKKKHDKLTPSMSSLIIINHVKDGIELARKYKLNQTIIDFMEQHHGTSLIFYFYQRALEKVEDSELPNEEGFRYPGPKPQTKEAAVVLLADSVEAASRALSEPTPARIKGLVRKIINNKFIDNQLDQCELTLKDLDIIAETFIRILMGIFHSRVEYGEAKEKAKSENNNKDKEQPKESSHK